MTTERSAAWRSGHGAASSRFDDMRSARAAGDEAPGALPADPASPARSVIAAAEVATGPRYSAEAMALCPFIRASLAASTRIGTSVG